MAELCDKCPMRGDAIGELVNIYTFTSIKKPISNGEWVEMLGSPLGVLVDEENNISEPFLLPDDTSGIFEKIECQVASCENKLPRETSKIYQIMRRRTCPVLGALAINDRALTKLLKSQANAQLL